MFQLGSVYLQPMHLRVTMHAIKRRANADAIQPEVARTDSHFAFEVAHLAAGGIIF